jgi:hypothetical protein
MTFAPTDLRTLEAAIVDGILAVTPSLDSLRPWNHDPRTHQGGPARALRQFFISWGSAEQVVEGATGNLDYEVRVPLVISTSYWAAEPDQVGELVAQDHFDLNRYFIDRLETIHGLTNWESDGTSEADDEARIHDHQFLVSYMRR